ncbi:MAG: pyrimidine operon regulatory protein/uracil phosphoribosyltransferase [Actinomycetota bacterium]
MSADDIRRAISRIAHEIVERNQGVDDVVLVGLQRGGTWIADLLGSRIAEIEPRSEVVVGRLDVSMFRDDIGIRPVVPGAVSEIPRDVTGAVVVLVDDVLYTGRTVRAALEGLNAFGRPRAVQLPSSSIAVIGSCRSGQISLVRTCRPIPPMRST